MSFRIEEKLLIGTNRIVDFKSFLFNKTIKQIYEPRKIHSLYFDNLNYEMYSDSLEGLTPRKKIRVRNYPDTKDQNLYLEIKISSVEGRFKTREILDQNKFNELKTSGIFDSQYGTCKPCLHVTYNREYFKKDDVRISIDNNINYQLFGENIHKKDESSIVEIKTSIKKDLEKLTKDFPFQKIRFSKYCNAVEKIIYR